MSEIVEKTATVHVVESVFSQLDAMARRLRDAGHAVLTYQRPLDLLSAAQGLRAGCIITDVELSGMSGFDLQSKLADGGCTLPLIFCAQQGDVPTAVAAMRGGAVDFLLWPLEETRLLSAVRRALESDAGERALRTHRRALQKRFERLRPRERQVLDYVARGLLNKQIAAELGLSEVTVKVYRAQGLSTLGVGSAAELASLLSSLPDWSDPQVLPAVNCTKR